MENTRTDGQKLYESLTYDPKNAWEKCGDAERKAAFEFCEGYKSFLSSVKTEREFAEAVVQMAGEHGFVPLDELKKTGKKLKPGMKVYRVNRNKSAAVSVIGTAPLNTGINIIGAHVDSPRIDIKQNPLYEDSCLVLLKTHYYGGIKKYQWVCMPLALHGVIIKKDNSVVRVSIGEDDTDPVFTITDLLPHLASEQMQKKMSEGITGEGLNLLFGSIPYADDKVKNKIKLNILKLLNEKYGMAEEDFISAELELVPAFKARDIGLDRSMVGAYGQDDRVCAYTSLKALLGIQDTARTALCFLTDKEEIGSMGNTGAESVFLENFIADLCATGSGNYTDIVLRDCLNNSYMLSADVIPAVDPSYEGVMEKNNAAYMGRGIVLQKYTGVKGKYDASDANAEYVSKVRKLFNDSGIPWQAAELGKVDQGGGGTIAQHMANMGIEVIDCGVSMLSMHSPFEITSKIDVYYAYKAYSAFYQKLKGTEF